MKKSNKNFIYSLLSIGLFLMLAAGCTKEDIKTENPLINDTAVQLPTLTTTSVSDILQTAATCGGNVIIDGGASVTSRGVCWGTGQTPTMSDSKTTDGAGLGTYTSNITGLTANTTYYARAYATNTKGTAYGAAVSFKTLASGGEISYGTMTDIEGNTYKTLTIGSQTWMVENLKVTKCNDGTAIPNVTDDSAWGSLITSGYCWYNDFFKKDSTINKATFGGLYNWYVATSGKLAPTGWHVPTDAEWTTLGNYLTTNNYTGFTAALGGYRSNTGAFINNGKYGYWWSSTEASAANGWGRTMDGYSNTKLYVDGRTKCYGLSVRCVKD